MGRDVPSFDVTPVRPGGRRSLTAVALALGVALSAAVTLGLSERARESAVAPSPVRVSVAPSPVPSGTATSADRSRPPRLLVPGDPVEIEPLLVRAGGPRMLDLASGRLGPELSTHPLDEWYQAPDGDVLCLCRTVTPHADGGDAVELWFLRVDADGRQRNSQLLLTTHSLPSDTGEVVDPPPGSGTTAHAALAPDGRTLLVAVADRTADGWRARLIVAHAAGERPALELPLAVGLPGVLDASSVDVTWNALEHDGAAVRATATVRTRSPDRRARSFALISVSDARSALVETWPGETEDPVTRCRSSFGPVLVASEPVQMCVRSWPPGTIAIRRFDRDGLVARDRTAGHDHGPLTRGEWLHVDAERIVHWDAATRHLALFDPSSGVLVATRDEAPLRGTASTDGLIGPTVAVDASQRAVVTLASDEAAWVNSDPVRSPSIRGDPPRIVARYSLNDVGPLARWTAPSTASSLTFAADGRYVLVAVRPSSDEPYPNPYAGVIAYDATTGDVRLVAGRLGDVPIRFASGGMSGIFAGD